MKNIFRWELEAQGERLLLRPIGQMDEDADFASVTQTTKALGPEVKGLDFDLSGVTQINSVGIREWLVFLGRVQSRFACRFLHVNEVFVDQAIMVPDILGKRGTAVVAFDAPYLCQSCDRRSIRVLRTEELRLDSATCALPEFSCETCGRKLAFDALEQEYLSFFETLRR